MYGRMVKYKGFDIWINCLPTTSEEELQRRAKNRYEQIHKGKTQREQL